MDFDDSVDGREGVLVELQWNDYDTGLFANKMFRHVRRGDVDFKLEAKRGSLLTEFLIPAAAVTTGGVLTNIIWYLFKRRQRDDGSSRDMPPATVMVYVDDMEQIIDLRNEEDVRRALELVEEVDDEDQSGLDDF
mgnify:CR=1 FL=1